LWILSDGLVPVKHVWIFAFNCVLESS
jgi:hypothetical protein